MCVREVVSLMACRQGGVGGGVEGGLRGVSGGRWLVRPPPLSRLEVLPSVLPHFPQSGARVHCDPHNLVKMTVMFQRSPAQTNGSLAKGERKRSMPPPVSTSPPLKKAKTLVVKEEQKEKEEKEESVTVTRESGGLVSQGSQTLPPSSQRGSSCKLHGDEEEEVCPIGTPVNLPATVWYEDRDGKFLLLCSHKAARLTPVPS